MVSPVLLLSVQEVQIFKVGQIIIHIPRYFFLPSDTKEVVLLLAGTLFGIL